MERIGKDRKNTGARRDFGDAREYACASTKATDVWTVMLNSWSWSSTFNIQDPNKHEVVSSSADAASDSTSYGSLSWSSMPLSGP